MLKIENTEVMGWEHAIRGMRNPKNSWEKSDSNWRYIAPAQRENHILASYVYIGNRCARPALALSSEILVSDSADSSGCYTIASAPAGEEYQKVNGVWMRMC